MSTSLVVPEDSYRSIAPSDEAQIDVYRPYLKNQQLLKITCLLSRSREQETTSSLETTLILILLPLGGRKRLIRLILANADRSPLLSLELEETREKQNKENRRVHSQRASMPSSLSQRRTSEATHNGSHLAMIEKPTLLNKIYKNRKRIKCDCRHQQCYLTTPPTFLGNPEGDLSLSNAYPPSVSPVLVLSVVQLDTVAKRSRRSSTIV